MIRRNLKAEMTPDEAAAWWIVRLDSSQASAGDRRKFEAWHEASPEHAEAFLRAEALLNISKYAAADPAILEMRQAALERPVPKYPGRLRLRAMAAVAASVVALLIGISALEGSPWRLSEAVTAFMHLFQEATPEPLRFAAGIGDRSTVTLADGSNVILDTDSEILVALTKAERKITLTRGQAFFEVAHDVGRPFTVQAGDHRVLATGTAFDVRLLKAGVDVTLVQGRVVVDQTGTQRKENENTAAAPDTHVELRPGERLLAVDGAPASVSAANIDRVTSWRTGQIIFLDTRLDDAIAEINRYTSRPVVLTDPALSDLRVNGVFRIEQPLEFAEAVAGIYALSAEPTVTEIRLRRKNP